MGRQAGASTGTAELLGAAARLNIGVGDLPDVGRRLTKAAVLQVRRQRPRWLSAARRPHGVGQQQARRKTRHGVGRDGGGGGFTRPDDGRGEMIPDVDDAYMDC